jgi:hypothetical protein
MQPLARRDVVHLGGVIGRRHQNSRQAGVDGGVLSIVGRARRQQRGPSRIAMPVRDRQLGISRRRKNVTVLDGQTSPAPWDKIESYHGSLNQLETDFHSDDDIIGESVEALWFKASEFLRRSRG